METAVTTEVVKTGIMELGFAIFLAAFLVVGIMLLLGWVVRRVFCKDGLAEKLVSGHLEFLGKIEACINGIKGYEKQQLDIAERSAQGIQELIALHRDPDSPVSTYHLHQAGLEIADIIEAVCKKLEIEEGWVDRKLNKIRSELGVVPNCFCKYPGDDPQT